MGRVMRLYDLFGADAPADSKGPYDYYKLVREIAPDDDARPLNEGRRPFVK